MKVLIAVKNSDEKKELVYMVKENGFRAASFSSKTKILNIIRTEAFDLAIIDLDAFNCDLIKDIKERRPDMRFITMTSYNSFVLEKEVRKCGVTIHLSKPARKEHIQPLLIHINKMAQKNERVSTIKSKKQN